MLSHAGGRGQTQSSRALPGTRLQGGRAHAGLESGFSSEGTGELSKGVEQRSDMVNMSLHSKALHHGTNAPQHLANQWHSRWPFGPPQDPYTSPLLGQAPDPAGSEPCGRYPAARVRRKAGPPANVTVTAAPAKGRAGSSTLQVLEARCSLQSHVEEAQLRGTFREGHGDLDRGDSILLLEGDSLARVRPTRLPGPALRFTSGGKLGRRLHLTTWQFPVCG